MAGVRLLRGGLQRPASEAPLRRSDVPWLLAVIAAGGIVGPVLLMLGLARSDAASGSLLLNLEGLATMGIAWVVFGENVDRRLLLGAFAILAGAVLLSWQGQGIELDWGAVLIAGACVAWGIDNNLTRKLSSADPLQLAMAKGLVAGAVNLGLALTQGAVLPRAGVILGAASSAFLATASAWRCSCWRCGTWGRPGPVPTSRLHPSSARRSRSACWVSPHPPIC